MNSVYLEKCMDCGKEFVYETKSDYALQAARTDCLNGSHHNYNPVNSAATDAPSYWVSESTDAVKVE